MPLQCPSHGTGVNASGRVAADQFLEFDTHTIVSEIKARFRPSSIREVPPEELDRLFQIHQTSTSD